MLTQAQEEKLKKLESRKANAIELTKLKTKFEAAKAKKTDLEQGALVTRAELTRLRSFVDKEEAKLANLEGGVKVANLAIFNVNNQAMPKAKHIASTKVEARK